jgi:hypothetical protein
MLQRTIYKDPELTTECSEEDLARAAGEAHEFDALKKLHAETGLNLTLAAALDQVQHGAKRGKAAPTTAMALDPSIWSRLPNDVSDYIVAFLDPFTRRLVNKLHERHARPELFAMRWGNEIFKKLSGLKDTIRDRRSSKALIHVEEQFDASVDKLARGLSSPAASVQASLDDMAALFMKHFKGVPQKHLETTVSEFVSAKALWLTQGGNRQMLLPPTEQDMAKIKQLATNPGEQKDRPDYKHRGAGFGDNFKVSGSSAAWAT